MASRRAQGQQVCTPRNSSRALVWGGRPDVPRQAVHAAVQGARRPQPTRPAASDRRRVPVVRRRAWTAVRAVGQPLSAPVASGQVPPEPSGAGRVTYVKLEHRGLGDERWLSISPAAFTVHVFALDYCNEQATDGFITLVRAHRLLCPVDPASIPEAFDELVAAGEWQRMDDGYLCPDFLAYGIAAEEQKATREKWSTDKRRQRLCRIGNHTLCTERSCKAVRALSTGGQVDTSTADKWSRPPGTSGRSDQTRSDPTRPDPAGVGVGFGRFDSAGADAQPIDPIGAVATAPGSCANCYGVRFTRDGECLNCGWSRR